jgi:predicted DNA-binding protein
MTSSQRRINARVPAEIARKLAVLEQRTGLGTTEIVLRAIERYHAACEDEAAAPSALLREAGFVGCADGPATLSRDYKAELTRSLGSKA